jgi:hypothetical protein
MSTARTRLFEERMAGIDPELRRHAMEIVYAGPTHKKGECALCDEFQQMIDEHIFRPRER